MAARGWDQADIILVTGDAYIDHPAFGVALIGRWLEAHGFKVAILAQPRHHNIDDFKQFGPPRLFYGITAGNLDSIVANYSGNKKVRDQDAYSPQGNPYFGEQKEKKFRRRPDRASILYTNLAKNAYPQTPVVLGGIEASLRRFVHYDYQQAKIRNSILTDAKADLLVYGMGEKAVLEIARRLQSGAPIQAIAGTCERLTDNAYHDRQLGSSALILPTHQNIVKDAALFLKSELLLDEHARSLSETPVLQRQKTNWLLQNQPATPLTVVELDRLYSLPFCRAPHPSAKDVPAYRMIRHSATIVRGCSGNCSFCAITRHQGPRVISRTPSSILKEIELISRMADFKGTISDLGGPTANLYGTSCRITGCKKQDCFYPKLCKNLQINEEVMIDLLQKSSKVKGVKHVFVSSGLRMELLLKTPRLLKELILHHTPGAMKIAPEHTEKEVLRLMHKPGSMMLSEFLNYCRKIATDSNHEIHFNPYVISAHPGCTAAEMRNMARKLKELGITARQPQDFTPTPGTISTAMYVSGLDRETGQQIHVPKNSSERQEQRHTLMEKTTQDKRPHFAPTDPPGTKRRKTKKTTK